MARRIPICMTGAGFPDESPVAPRWTGLAGTAGAAAARSLCPQVVPRVRTPATLKKSRRVPDVSMSALRLIIKGMLPLRLRGTEQSATLSCARSSEPQRRNHSSRQSPPCLSLVTPARLTRRLALCHADLANNQRSPSFGVAPPRRVPPGASGGWREQQLAILPWPECCRRHGRPESSGHMGRGERSRNPFQSRNSGLDAFESRNLGVIGCLSQPQ